jgi:hypothetical protein
MPAGFDYMEKPPEKGVFVYDFSQLESLYVLPPY